MEQLQFLVQGSADEPYRVTFTIEGENLNAFCTCPAGENGQYCKHRLNLLAGDSRGIVGDGAQQIPVLLGWLVGSDVEAAIEQVHDAEKGFLLAKKRLADAKKRVAAAMRS